MAEIEYSYRQNVVQTWEGTMEVPESVIAQGEDAVLAFIQAIEVKPAETLGDCDYGDEIENSYEVEMP